MGDGCWVKAMVGIWGDFDLKCDGVMVGECVAPVNISP